MIDITKPRDGDALTAASIQDIFTALETGVNNLDEDATSMQAFNRAHFDRSPFRFDLISPSLSVSAWHKTYGNDAAPFTFSNKYPGYNTSSYGGSGSGGSGATNWRGIDPNAQITFTALKLGNARANRLRGIMLAADLHISEIIGDGTVENYMYGAAAAFMWYDGVNWTVIPGSERYMAQYQENGTTAYTCHRNLSLRYPLTDAETANNNVSGVQAVIAFAYGSTAPVPGPDPRVRVDRYTVSAIPIQAG